tara:strand:+ start:126 stop:344 length:219 start_codon:yes stop_codon:yes gene_type:complete
MKWWESNHLESTRLNYFQHLILGIQLSFLALSVFVLGIIHSFIPNFLPFLPIELIYKIKEMFEHNYSTKPNE